MATRYEYYIVGDQGQQGVHTVWHAQTFTPSVAHKITSVKLLLWRYNNPGTLTVSIRAVDGAGKPTGGDLCSGTTNGNSLPTEAPYEWREITLGAGAPLNADTQYAIVARALDGDGSNFVYWRGGYTPPDVYADGGSYSSDDGVSWTGYGWDLMFEDWGEPLITYYHGLKVRGVGELALCDVVTHPLRIRKGGTTYGIELVNTSDANASKIRIKTGARIKAIRKYT